MKKINIYIIGVLIFAFISSAIVFASQESNTTTINLKLLMNQEEGKLFQESMEEAIGTAKILLENRIANTKDPDEVKYLEGVLRGFNKNPVSDLFEKREDGNVEINIPYANQDIQIDGQNYKTNIKGEVNEEIKSLKNKTAEIKDGEITFDTLAKNETSNVDVVFSLEDLGEGIKNMGERVKAESVLEGDFVSPVLQIFQPYIKIKDEFGTQNEGGKSGNSRINDNPNIVGCNKLDKEIQNLNPAEFALQSSDCARNVKIAIVILAAVPSSSPEDIVNFFNLYGNSVYCYAEAIDGTITKILQKLGIKVDDYKNVYCNGKKYKNDDVTSKNGHINCSWFTGIEHSESAHLHYYYDEK